MGRNEPELLITCLPPFEITPKESNQLQENEKIEEKELTSALWRTYNFSPQEGKIAPHHNKTDGKYPG